MRRSISVLPKGRRQKSPWRRTVARWSISSSTPSSTSRDRSGRLWARDGQGGGRRVDQCRSGRDGGSVSPPWRNADRKFVCPAPRRKRGEPSYCRREDGG